MVPEVLSGVLWLARLGLRSQVGVMRAGHGYADPGFRPATLPFASLVGPLGVDVEPERDQPVPSDVLVQLPGFLVGNARDSDIVADGATLTVVFDDSATADIVLDAGSFASPSEAVAVCADIEDKLRAQAASGGFRDAAGDPIDDPQRIEELENVTCRWDAAAAAVVLSSGRRGHVSRLALSRVAVTGGTAATALGFEIPSRGEPGRHARQRAPAPKGFAIDVRLDLWASNQRDLGYVVDALVRSVPTRTRIVTRPALLAEDLEPGDLAVRLLATGEPTTPESLLHLESSDGFLDRVSGVALATTAGAAAELVPPRLRFEGDGVARRTLAHTPSVPDPRRADALAPRGVALTLGLRLVNAGAGHTGTIASLESGGRSILVIGYAVVDTEPGAGTALVVDLTARAAFRALDDSVADASVTRRVPLESLAAGASIHVVAHAGPGVVSIAVNGVAQDLADTEQTPEAEPPVVTPGMLAIDGDLEIVLGNAAGNPAAFELEHVHLLAAPVLALDSRLRGSVSAADEFRPGDHIAFADSDRGLVPLGETEGFFVREVAGDAITLDRPVARRWRRNRTLVHSRDCFVQQREAKRRDDLMNRLYRYCIGYRVSAFLEQPDTPIVGGLVIEPVVEIEPRGSHAPRKQAPGVRAKELPPIRITQASQE